MRMRGAVFALCLLLGSGCSFDGDTEPEGPGDPDDPDDPDPVDHSVRFVVMGDTGEGNDGQRRIADAIAAKCAADGCDFVVLLGDNIYDEGVEDVADGQWQSKFEQPYGGLDLPFYAVLGNHDYGGTLGGGMGNEFWKGPVEVEYSDHSSKWIMPATHYTMRHQNVGFVMIDTNSLIWDNVENGDQRDWYPSAMAEIGGVDWVIAAGHHPYRSNGPHGNAGNYEGIEVGGIEIPNPVPLLNGSRVKSYFDEVMCGSVDFYFAGHDHNRQWLAENDRLCGAELIVSGAGSKVKELHDRGNQVHYADGSEIGFFYAAIEGNTFTGQFLDSQGNVDFERTVSR